MFCMAATQNDNQDALERMFRMAEKQKEEQKQRDDQQEEEERQSKPGDQKREQKEHRGKAEDQDEQEEEQQHQSKQKAEARGQNGKQAGEGEEKEKAAGEMGQGMGVVLSGFQEQLTKAIQPVFSKLREQMEQSLLQQMEGRSEEHMSELQSHS